MLLVAHDLNLFDLLATRPRTFQEICGALQIAARPAEALVAVCTSLGYLDLRDGRYSLIAPASGAPPLPHTEEF
jgi:Dimerisation domain